MRGGIADDTLTASQYGTITFPTGRKVFSARMIQNNKSHIALVMADTNNSLTTRYIDTDTSTIRPYTPNTSYRIMYNYVE